ncbi:uncharacterized protein LOC116846447 [Odontomachus brunneus]|uniref:uncharacterized protein LOC116846447 n=1 Tax=Odontomachus brunneus TaxID=486640 RepID=UPI0013F1C206|nr:uncharacterized protein LOC116846447 [Odontomachus brunneus]
MLSVKHFIKYINNKKYTLQLGYIKMVWKCCVPECKSSWEMPVHRFPVDPARIERWLIAIHKTDLIGAPKETLAKLRICTEHFSEDMVLPYGRSRRLTDNAVPNLNLPLDIVEHVNDNVVVNVNFDEHVNLVENVPDNSDFVPLPIVMGEEDIRPERRDHRMLRRKLRTQQKMLHKKKRIIYNQRQEINRLRRGNKWEDATKDMSTIQKIFLEMLTTNLKCAPQVCFPLL